MAKVKAQAFPKRRRPIETQSAAVYRGRQARAGNSLALRFERALFRSHPEFQGEVRARVIGPGRMLVVAEPVRLKVRADEDPVLASFVSFLAGDMGRFPARLKPLDQSFWKRANTLLRGVNTTDDEDLGGEALI